jgi:hypothetical protein
MQLLWSRFQGLSTFFGQAVSSAPNLETKMVLANQHQGIELAMTEFWRSRKRDARFEAGLGYGFN